MTKLLGRKKSKPTLPIGSHAPSFELLDQETKVFSLDEFLGNKIIILFFYPMNYSPICTLEAIAFRESYVCFVDLGAEVIGVSCDRPQSHAKFCDFLHLRFKLLSDPHHVVRDKYLPGSEGRLRFTRVTFVIDLHGIVRGVTDSLLSARKHVNDALDVVRLIQSEELNQFKKKAASNETA